MLTSINLVVEEAGVLGEEPPTMDKQPANFITCESRNTKNQIKSIFTFVNSLLY
jgi:hypothetical protein